MEVNDLPCYDVSMCNVCKHLWMCGLIEIQSEVWMPNQPSWLILSSTNLILIFNCKFFLFCAKTDMWKRIFQITSRWKRSFYPANSNLNCLNTTSKDDEQYCLNPYYKGSDLWYNSFFIATTIDPTYGLKAYVLL